MRHVTNFFLLDFEKEVGHVNTAATEIYANEMDKTLKIVKLKILLLFCDVIKTCNLPLLCENIAFDIVLFAVCYHVKTYNNVFVRCIINQTKRLTDDANYYYKSK